MAKIVKQFRFYGQESSSNTSEASGFVTGRVFFRDSNINGSIIQLGVQTLPGTKFYINDSADAIVVGSTGIYELDIQGLSDITSLNFDSGSMKVISETNGAYLIVDAIYETEEE